MGLNFDISLSGLRAAQKMITVSQNNIANATNTSYARQRVEVNASDYPLGVSGINAQLGSGVVVEEVKRVVDELLIQQSRTEMGTAGYYKGVQDVLSNIETVFNETGENSISDLLTNMFNSFEELSKFPEQSSYRLNVSYAGTMLSEKLRGISSQLDEIKEQTDTKIKTEVSEVNKLIDKISNVNKKMETITTEQANALLDERDKYLDELSGYLDVKVTNKDNPMNMEVKIGNTTLISGSHTYPVKANYVAENDTWIMSASDVQFLPNTGSLSGLLKSRNDYIDTYESKLNVLVSNLITEINDLHSNGFGLDNSTGLNFFVGTDIRTIEVNSVISSDPSKIAVSSEIDVKGNTDIGRMLSDLKDKTFVNGVTPHNFYQSYTVELASDLNIAKENYSIHSDVQTAMESQRQSIQGVNIDEDMTELLLVQKYYQANAKTLSTTDKMLEELLNII